MSRPGPSDQVGPVLVAGEVADGVLRVLRAAYPAAVVQDRGAYRRVLVDGFCRLGRSAVEAELGRPFALRIELEAIMPSFRGNLVLSDDEATWSYAPPGSR